jgi:Protein of unknown function (DUF1566)
MRKSSLFFMLAILVLLALSFSFSCRDDDDDDDGGSSFCERILTAVEECDMWFDHYVDGNFVDYTRDEMMALCEGDWEAYFECSDANRQEAEDCHDWHEKDLNECEDLQWGDDSKEDCKATVEKILFYCEEFISDADAFYEAVCEEYEDPDCLEWCWEHRTGCEDTLSCYEDDECVEDSDDDDDDDDDSGGDDDDTASGGDTWTDPSSGLMWQDYAEAGDYLHMPWEEAKTYCANLSFDGHDDWRLPTISELRSLIRGCDGTVTGGSCGVTDSCLDSSCLDESCYSCDPGNGPNNGCYGPSELSNPCDITWSSSPVEDGEDDAWAVVFGRGHLRIVNTINYDYLFMRCVRL